MNTTTLQDKRGYFRAAADQIRSPRMLIVASLIVALRVAVKWARIPLAAGLTITFDCYVNALGSMVYGPIMGLLVGAVSDTIGCIVAPIGPYFLPFVLIEMSSSFLFGLFFWRRVITVPRALFAKFTVNMVCNIILTSIFQKWSYYVFYGLEKAEAYALVNGVRIVKNLVMFPLEAVLIVVLLNYMLPVLQSAGVLPRSQQRITLTKRHFLLIALLLVASIALICFYVFFFKQFMSEHNFKFF